MATDRDIAIRLHAINNLLPGLGSAEKSIKLFVSKSTSQFKGLKIAGAAAIGITAAAMFAMGKRVVDLDAKMVRLKINSGLSSKEMIGFKNQILDTGIATGNTGDDMTDLASAALHGSNNIGFVRSELGFLAKVMNASGASAEELGESLGDAFKEAKMGTKDFETLISTLYSISKKSGREQSFKDMLPNLPTMIRDFKTANPNASFKDIQNYIAMGIFSKNPQAINRAMRMMMTKLNSTQVNMAMGTNFRPGEMSIASIMDVIYKKTPDINKRLQLMRAIFGRTGFDLSTLRNNWEEYSKAVASSNVTDVLKDSDEKAQSISGKIAGLSAVFDKISTSAMGPAIDEFTKALGKISPEDIKALTDEFTAFGKALAGMVLYLAQLPANLEKMGAALHRFVSNQDYKDLKANAERMGTGPVTIVDPNAPKPQEARPLNASIPGAPTTINANFIVDGKNIPVKVVSQETRNKKTGEQVNTGVKWGLLENR